MNPSISNTPLSFTITIESTGLEGNTVTAILELVKNESIYINATNIND